MDTIVWICIIIGLTVVTLFALVAMFIMRKREQLRDETDETTGSAVERIDAAADSALEELNKTSAAVLDEINEKYRAMLFLYNLLDEKKKEISTLTDQKHQTTEEVRPPETKSPEEDNSKTRRIVDISANTRYKKIKSLFNEGLRIPDIAKKLNIGQGEVKLLLDLAEKQDSLPDII